MATLQIYDLNLSESIMVVIEGTPAQAHSLLQDKAGTWWELEEGAVLLSDSWEALYYEGTVTQEDAYEGGAFPTHRLISESMAAAVGIDIVEEV